MAPDTLKRLHRPGFWPVAIFIVVLFVALHLISDAVQNTAGLSRLFVPLLGMVLVGLMLLAVLLVVNVSKLVSRYRSQAAGSRLTGRMVVMFALISVVPVSVVYYYSLGFLLKGIDSWFDVQIDQAMEDALSLTRASLGLNQRVLLKYTKRLLSDIEDQSETALALSLDELRQQAGALEVTVFGDAGQVYGYSSVDPSQLVPDQPSNEILQQLRLGNNYVGLVSANPDELLIRVLVHDPANRPLNLQALYPTSERVSQLSHRLEGAYNRYKELSYLRQSLKFSFSLTLSLVLVFSLFSAMIAAFHSARRLVAPVADIANGTRAVAAGDYDQQLPSPKHADELGFLVDSFNIMTRRIAQARDEAARSQHQVEAQRAYLQTVLGSLSTGVMAFDAGLALRTANSAAHQILKMDLDAYIGQPLERLAGASPRMMQLVEMLKEPLGGPGEWRGEAVLFGGDGRQVLMCRSAAFSSSEGGTGHVLVFDDITTLIKAQREAAWGEVARRLAHEIKNPLTPIQLSAERLRHKYLERMPPDDAKVLDRATRTIVQQVDAMKAMVNAFSEYARPPRMQSEALELDRLVSDVLDLYQDARGRAVLRAELRAPGIRVKADPVRLRQVIHNLTKNALEATEDTRGREVRVLSRLYQGDDTQLVELRVEDNGPGFSDEVLERLFEPYVTTKAKGTGLGLAIVKKIVEEHGGIIWAENKEQGARVVLRLPTAGSGEDRRLADGNPSSRQNVKDGV